MRRVYLFLCLQAVLGLAQCKKGQTVTAGGSNRSSFGFNSLSVKSIEADSISSCIITIQLGQTTSSGSNAIVVSTTLGQFPNGLTRDTAFANTNGMATIPLLSDAAGYATVSAINNGVTVDTSISFTPALPDDMLCTANQYTGPDSVGFNMTCDLYRNPGRGKVTNPIKVLFSLMPTTANNTAPSLLIPSFSNSNAGVVMDSIQNPYRDTGTFVIQAAAPLDNGSTLYRSVTLIIK